MPHVSVIIPIYNSEAYLAECLDSALAQTFEDIEVVCVNDGSTDGSARIVEERARQDERVVIITQENRGLGAARNAGVDKARGDYLYFLDSDDRLAGNALEELTARANADNLDVLYFGAVPFCDDADLTSIYENFESYYRRENSYPGVMSGKELLVQMFENGDYRPSVCFQLFRADFCRRADLRFHEGIVHEDNLFSFRCALKAQRAGYVTDTYYQRRIRKDSVMTADKSVAHFDGFMTCYVEMLRIAMSEALDERTARASAALVTEIFQQALKVYRRLPEDKRTALTPIDSTPESLIAMERLKRQASLEAKARRLKKELAAKEARLDDVLSSRAYRLARALRKLVPFRS